ncbi:MerR family transcriptional regulator [Corynebacterium sp.]|uniref:MerR family transcriptional regulator n=1 Tax=Corynebacterium sp. TaxID=1720 RepID=UPI003B3A418A
MLIGEVSRRSGISVRMLRHYDSRGLVSPSHRTGAGYREYSRGDLTRLMKVESLRSLGMGITDVRAALDDPGLDVAAVLDRLREETRGRIRAEQALLGQLDSLRDRAGTVPDSWDDVLAVTSLLAALRSPYPAERQTAALRTPPGRATAALVASYLDETDPNVAGTLRWSLTQTGEDAVPALTARMASADAATRLRIAEALGAITGDTATAALTTLSDDEEQAVRSRAVLSLAHRVTGVELAEGPADLAARLVAMVIDGDHDVDAADALARLCHRNPSPEKAVVARLTSAGQAASPDARLRTVQALAELSVGRPDGPSGAALTTFTADPDRTVALTAQALTRR